MSRRFKPPHVLPMVTVSFNCNTAEAQALMNVYTVLSAHTQDDDVDLWPGIEQIAATIKWLAECLSDHCEDIGDSDAQAFVRAFVDWNDSMRLQPRREP
jgi:hypothetical protein